MTAVGFEPTPLRNGALSHRLRPLGQTVLKRKVFFGNQYGWEGGRGEREGGKDRNKGAPRARKENERGMGDWREREAPSLPCGSLFLSAGSLSLSLSLSLSEPCVFGENAGFFRGPTS